MRGILVGLSLLMSLGLGGTAPAAEMPKRGGVLTYMIPADGGPSLDGHKETTLRRPPRHGAVLLDADPGQSRTTHPPPAISSAIFAPTMPAPTDNGLTWTHSKSASSVKFHDGTPLDAHDVAASWRRIVFPPPGVSSARRTNSYLMVDKIEDPDDTTVVIRLKFPTLSFLPALAEPLERTSIRAQNPRQGPTLTTSETSWAPARSNSKLPRCRPIHNAASRNPDYLPSPANPISTASTPSSRRSSRRRVDAIRADRAALEFRGESPSARDQSGEGTRRQDHGAGERLELRQRLHAEPQAQALRRPARAPRAVSWPIDQWRGAAGAQPDRHRARPLAAMAFPGSPLAATREELDASCPASPCRHRNASRAEAPPPVEGGRRRGPVVRDAEPQRRSALHHRRHVAGGRVPQDRRHRHAEDRPHRSLAGGDARTATSPPPWRPTARMVVNPIADVGRYLPKKLLQWRTWPTTRIRNPERNLPAQMVRDDGPGQGRACSCASTSGRSIEVGAHQLPVTLVVLPHPADPLLREGLEDQQQPLPQPGSRRTSGSTNKCSTTSSSACS